MKYINSEKLKAEIERLKKEYYNDGTFMDSVAETALNKLLSSIKSQEQEPSLHSTLDETAEECIMSLVHNEVDWKIPSDNPELSEFVITFLYDMFKAGAEWMARQGVTVDGLVVCDKDTHYYKDIVMEIPDTLNVGDKVIVQIRKKDENRKIKLQGK